jgi:hypothetical protein
MLWTANVLHLVCAHSVCARSVCAHSVCAHSVCAHSFRFGFKPLLKIQQKPLATVKLATVLRRAYRLKLVISWTMFIATAPPCSTISETEKSRGRQVLDETLVVFPTELGKPSQINGGAGGGRFFYCQRISLATDFLSVAVFLSIAAKADFTVAVRRGFLNDTPWFRFPRYAVAVYST